MEAKQPKPPTTPDPTRQVQLAGCANDSDGRQVAKGALVSLACLLARQVAAETDQPHHERRFSPDKDSQNDR